MTSKAAPAVVGVVGPPGPSTALLVATLVEAMRERGRRTATIERRRGGATVTLTSGGRVSVERDLAAEDLAGFVAGIDPSAELVLASGYEDASELPTVEVTDGQPQTPTAQLLATVPEAWLTAGLGTSARLEAVEGVAAALEAALSRRAGAATPAIERAAPRGWRRTAIVAIKVVHTALFVLISGAILRVFLDGLRGRWTGATRLALAVSLGESALVFANRMRCPLTQLVERLGAEDGRVSDIFLPRWFADHVPHIFVPPLALGTLLIAWRRVRERR